MDRDLYGALEAHINHGYRTLSGQSTITEDNRLKVYGMKNVPEQMLETIMITVMHILSQRIKYNVELQRATHVIVDEAQYICKHESSCNELNKAYLTYRKFGGICTICLQNVSAAMANDKILEIVSNSDFKVFLDQGGDDRNQLSKILEMSDQEFRALADPEPGQCLIVWGDKILQCDSKISKENPLYQFYTTNFHEAAKQNRNVFYQAEEENPAEREEVITEAELTMQEKRLVQCVKEADSIGEVIHAYEAALLCEMDEEETEKILDQLCKRRILQKDKEKNSYKLWN